MNELLILNIIISTALAVLGASIGSFLNVVALRSKTSESFVKGRSHCPHCSYTLQWYDLLPIAGWLLLTGKCRKCKATIPLRYLLVEIVSATTFVVSFLVFGFTWQTLLILAFTTVLISVSLFDLSTTEIPDKFHIMIFILTIPSIWVFNNIGLLSRGIGFFAVSLPMLLLALFIAGAFGGGDIKLMAAVGLFMGWQLVILAFFIAILIGGTFAIYVLSTKKRKKGEHFVFGPALCIGIFLSMLFGELILDWYLGLLVF